MNHFSLSSDSRRWWWSSAAAGALATTAVGAILVLPATGNTAPIEAPRHEVPATVFPAGPGDRPCFLVRMPWNVALDGTQPTCGRTAGATDDRPGHGVVRDGLDHLP